MKNYVKKHGLSGIKHLNILKNVSDVSAEGAITRQRKSDKKLIRETLKQYNTSVRVDSIKMIGVAGLCDGAGTTQLCIMLATFFSGVLKKRTAVVGDAMTYSLMLRQMPKARAIHHKGIGSRHAYNVNGIDYYCGMQQDYTGILRQRYDVIIQDISLNNTEDTLARTISRLSGCDVRMLSGSMLPWKSKECEKKIERIERFLDIKGLKMVTLSLYGKDDISIIEKYGIKIVPMPFERNPFVLSANNLQSFARLLELF